MSFEEGGTPHESSPQHPEDRTTDATTDPAEHHNNKEHRTGHDTPPAPPSSSEAEERVVAPVVTRMIPKEADGIVPKHNRDYESRDYWEERFAVEESYEWLLSFRDLRDQIVPLLQVAPPPASPALSASSHLTESPLGGDTTLPSDLHNDHDDDRHQQENTAGPRILVLGCGNSSLSADLYDAGFRNVVSIDFSETVIRAMTQRHAVDRPEMEWHVADLTDLSDFVAESFDVVLDKATIDSLLAGEGDVWNPCDAAVDRMRQACCHVSRILKEGGTWIQVSLVQPQFRIPYLLGRHGQRNPASFSSSAAPHRDDSSGRITTTTSAPYYSDEFGWTVRVEAAGVAPGERPSAAFGHFLYVVEKRRRCGPSAPGVGAKPGEPIIL